MSEDKKSIIPCEMIQDLLPSYVDELTSEVSNQEIRRHLDGCSSCSAVLRRMKGELPDETCAPTAGGENEGNPEEKMEIDFLKKSRRRSQQTVATALAIIVIMVMGMIARPYMHKELLDLSAVDVDLQVSDVDTGNGPVTNGLASMTITAKNGRHPVESQMHLADDGTLLITYYGVKRFGQQSEQVSETFSRNREIKRIVFNDQLLWHQGIYITQEARDLKDSAHPYIGDMPENAKTARALGIQEVFGSFSNELQTKQEPYGWTITFDRHRKEYSDEVYSKYARYYSYCMMAVIDNLSSVTFRYVDDKGIAHDFTNTLNDTREYLGLEIKDCSKSAVALQQLMTAIR